ncbi:MAG: plasmid pRiA4b ORF-3 family protein [Actinomycetota bacterium]|nr:plasmid pRiA4b ORF-3 family protein [Actinomycetota bacterium]
MSSIHTIKVSLRYMQPPVWRRLQIPSGTNLAELHHIIQAAMGWDDCHLHQFEVNGRYYADPEHMLEVTGDEARGTLAGMNVGDRFAYWYDFGDEWWHDIEVESVDQTQPGLMYPRCVTGSRACPPEDSGGPWGFDELMRALGDEKHRQHELHTEWMRRIGHSRYDPAHFDLDEINEALARLATGALQL